MAGLEAVSGGPDGATLVDLIEKIPDDDYYEGVPLRDELKEALEGVLISLLNPSIGTDDLSRIADALNRSNASSAVMAALDAAIQYEINEVVSIVAEIDSESTLKDHIDSLQSLGKQAGVPPKVVQDAVDKVRSRITELQKATSEQDALTINRPAKEKDDFDDNALNNLFASLLSKP